jgi:uncharacterized protein YfdQ (DUF2303 family)
MDNVQLIQDTAVQAAGANKLTGSERAVVVSQGYNVKDLEYLGNFRRRYRGKLTTTSLDDFAAYVKSHANPAADAFVDTNSMSGVAIFNLGNATAPGHGDYQAILNLPPTAAFAALKTVSGTKLSQKALADWLEDWNEFITPEYAEADATLARAIAAVRKITIKAKAESTSVTNSMSGSRSTLEEIDAQSTNDLPVGFNFVCEPYLGLMSRKFRLSISVISGDEKPALVLRWQQREAWIEKIAREFKDVLARALGDSANLTLGTFEP